MPGPIKQQKKDRPVSSFEKDDRTGPDAVPRADKDAPKAPRAAEISSGLPQTAQTLVVQRPPQLPQKDAMGMMASKPAHVPTPSTVVVTSNPNITNPAGLAQFKSLQAEKELLAAQEAAKEQAQRDAVNNVGLGASVAFGPVGGLTIQKALDTIRRLKQQGQGK